MAVEEPIVGKVYRVNIYPGCEGELLSHPARPYAHGHDWLLLGKAPCPQGQHKFRGMDLSRPDNHIYYLAPSELEEPTP